MERCRYSEQYKGIHKPRCNDGAGCDYCNVKYAEAQAMKHA